jgi:hypothetical protein
MEAIMSKKLWIYQDETKYGIYQNKSRGAKNDNPVVIEISNPRLSRIDGDSNSKGKIVDSLRIELPIKVFDRMASSWCEKRGISSTEKAPTNAKNSSTNSVSDRLIDGVLYYMPMIYIITAGVTAGIWLF